MTRARALKQTIRARAAKTGERYTTARRHILRELNQKTGPATAKAAALQAKSAKSPKPTMSDASFVKKTGHDLAYWFAVLDKFGAVEKGHTAAAKHLYADHKVDGWYAQGITVSYERARGVRAMNQRCDGAFEVSASKVVTASPKQLVKAFTDARERERWIGDANPRLAEALAKGLTDNRSKGVVVRPDGLVRYRYKWDDTTVQFYMAPKPGGKFIVTVTHMKLANGEAVETSRRQWRTALAALAGHFTA
jgi:uncharacterized protein YndB with AHSA1/START domain